MKKMVCRTLAMLLVLVCLCPAAYARISGVNVLGIRMAEEPVMYVELRAMDSNGEPAKAQYVTVRLYGGEEQIELQPEPVPSGSSGHIIVVDTSVYYYDSGRVKADDVRSIVSEYLSRVSGEERVLFILAGESATVVDGYMSVSDAKVYVNNIEFGKKSSACINTAICEAFQHAISPAQDAPMFNSVFIVADPDVKSNTTDSATLDEAAALRSVSGLMFDVAVAVPRRDAYLSDAPEDRRKGISEGIEKYKSFSSKIGGRFIPVPQDNDGITARDLHEALTGWADTAMRYQVDYSALAGYVPVEDGVQEVPLTVRCSAAGYTAEIGCTLSIHPELLPEPNWTPEPMFTPSAPTPVIWLDQKDEKAVRVIHELHKLGYLSKSGYSSFNSECMSAYYTFCEINDIEPRDGIYEDTLDLILSGAALPMPTPEPDVTPTPAPTLPPNGLRINDQDTKDSSFISQLQQVLTALNCYLPGTKATPGRMDQATLDAVNRYCDGYNWRNDYVDGVDARLCKQIIEQSKDLTPLPDIEPTLQETLQEFLRRELEVGSMRVEMWIPVAACGALLMLIIILAVLLGGRKERKARAAAAASAAAGIPGGTGTAEKEIQPALVEEPGSETVPQYVKIKLYITIEYNGSTRSETLELGDKPPCTIGRKDCQLLTYEGDKSVSRKHAELKYKGGHVYARDISSYHNTYLNGHSVRTDGEGTVVSNGDKLQLSSHTITIRW